MSQSRRRNITGLAGLAILLLVGYGAGYLGATEAGVSPASAAAGAGERSAAPCDDPWQETRLFMGQEIPSAGDTSGDNGGMVSTKDWQSFVGREIIPRFPDGFTILRGAGFWRGDDCDALSAEGGCEAVRVLLVDYPLSSDGSLFMQDIAAAYARAFRQEAVWRTDSLICIEVVTAED